jgi:hypothetical protein
MAAGPTYTPIATTTLSTSGTVTFSSIPQTYTDLVIICNGYNATQDGGSPTIQFNSDTSTSGTNYSDTYLSGDGSSATSGRHSSSPYVLIGAVAGWDTTSTDRASSIVNIFNYSNTTTYKSVLIRSNLASGTYPGAEVGVSLWRSTAAISTINLQTSNFGNFATGSTFTLYGIAAA